MEWMEPIARMDDFQAALSMAVPTSEEVWGDRKSNGQTIQCRRSDVCWTSHLWMNNPMKQFSLEEFVKD